jgi:hypothetical protein
MCTVSYVPLGSGNYILTSNRDEDPERVTLEPGKETTIVDTGEIICPKDSKAGGSWIAMSTDGRVACLLNGAFKKHHHNPPYSRSRGLVVMEYFSSESAIQFHNKVNLQGVENFTLLMLENGMVYEFRWDGEEKFFQLKDETDPHIWSSCTLYDEDTAADKEFKFMDWIEEQDKVTPKDIVHFHGYQNPDGFLLDLPMVKTVSITCIFMNGNKMHMKYHDLLTRHDADQSITLS